MAQILIRNLPDEAKDALRKRAGANGRSMEAEARSILIDFVIPDAADPVLAWLDDADELRASDGGFDAAPAGRRTPRAVDLG